MANLCVNALNGLTSFLPIDIDVTTDWGEDVCQRPKRAYFISTREVAKISTGRDQVSTP